MLDAAVAARAEKLRPQRQQSAAHLARQLRKILAAVQTMSRDLGDRIEPAAGGASGLQLVGVCWYRSASRSSHAACAGIETAESRPAERINEE